MHAGEPINDAYEVIAGGGSLDLRRKGGSGEIIGDGQNLQHPPVSGVVKREVECLYVVWEMSMEPFPRVVEVPTRACLRRKTRTRRPSSPQRRCTRL